MSWLSSLQSEQEAQEAFVQALIMSHSLADEPELEDLLFDPMQSVNTMMEVVTEMGLANEDGGPLKKDLPEDTQMEIQERVATTLLSKKAQQRFENAIAHLVNRLESTQDEQKLVSATAVQFFMKSIKDKAGWSTLGVVQEIVRRSLDAGFEIMQFVDERVSEEKSVVEILESLGKGNITKTFESMVRKIPGLRSYLEKEADSTWEDGMKALESGKLNLELFSDEELRGGINIMVETLNLQTDDQAAEKEGRPFTVTEEQGKTFIKRLDEYITGFLTPERFEQLRVHLDSYLNDPGDKRPYVAFIGVVDIHLREADTVEDSMWFLLKSFVLEMQHNTPLEAEKAEGDQ